MCEMLGTKHHHDGNSHMRSQPTCHESQNISVTCKSQVIWPQVTSMRLTYSLLSFLTFMDKTAQSGWHRSYQTKVLIQLLLINNENRLMSFSHSVLHVQKYEAECNDTITWQQQKQKEKGHSTTTTCVP